MSKSNRLSNAPTAPADGQWRRRDSDMALYQMVAPADLSVVFQPIYRFKTNKTFAYEALVRCAVPRFAAPPDLFRQAVSARCAGRLGRVIREIAVPLCGATPVFVNVHPSELNESWLVRPDDPIYSHDAEVFIEVTETVPLTHFDLCLSILREVRSRGGVYLVVDDLGAGYSNLKRIADLEPSVVKLDRALIAETPRFPKRRDLVKAVVRLCHDLDAEVVIEGIETRDECQVAIDSGAEYGQGYYLARPGFPLPTVSL